VQRPLALVVVGGMLLAPVLILLVLPVLILRFSKAQELPPEPDRETPADGRPGDRGPAEAAPDAGG
jgi:cobalt-zinc-cadmium resistance protein CzcA